MAVDTEKAPPVSDDHIAEGDRRRSLQTGSIDDIKILDQLGYKPELSRNRSMFTLLFQSLAIAAIPYGLGGPLISAIYGGGPLALFVGWIVVLVLDECVALSLSELASKYPTSAGPYYWSFQLATKGKTALSFITGWTWLVGNWTISECYLATTLSILFEKWKRQIGSVSGESCLAPFDCSVKCPVLTSA
jgi:amino acid transporter